MTGAELTGGSLGPAVPNGLPDGSLHSPPLPPLVLHVSLSEDFNECPQPLSLGFLLGKMKRQTR